MVQIIRAAAGVLVNKQQVLMVSRPPGKIQAGSWEFPGGKLEVGEDAVTALVRELKEEMGVSVAANDCERLMFITQDYLTLGYQVELDVFVIRTWQGKVVALEGHGLYWQDLSLKSYPAPLLPTTQKILDLLVRQI